jgi:glycosyltransferase involved in cell wall biosynthesis
MRIAFLIAKDLLDGGGGIEKVTREVGRRLAAKGHSVVAYSTAASRRLPAAWEGIELRWLPRMKPYWAEKLAGSIYGAALAGFHGPRPDLFHLHSVAAGSTALFLRLSGVPCVLQMHGVEWQRSRWGNVAKATLRALEKLSFANAAAVTAVSRRQCDFYRRRFGVPVAFIPTGTSICDPVPPVHLSQLDLKPEKYFLTAVRLVREKGLHYLIPAFHRSAGDWTLVIAGAPGGDEGYVKLLRDLAGGSGRIRFLGHVQEPLLGELYSNAGAYVQASEIEGMSTSLLDAMSYGRCCIVSDIPENLDVLGSAGIAFRSADIENLAHRLASVTQSGEMSRLLGSMARKRVLAHFSWDSIAEELISLYSETIQHAARHSREDASRSWSSSLGDGRDRRSGQGH